MKNIYLAVFTVTILILNNAHANGQFGGGDGSSGSPFQISTPEHLNAIRDGYLGDESTAYYFLQTADIDLSEYENWQPIGGGGTADKFQGHYDGAGYTITNLTIDRPNTPNVGLFGHIGPLDSEFVNSVSIKNVRLTDVNVKGARGTGGLVGRVTGSENTLIESCYVLSGSVTGDAATGGLVGSNNSYVTGSTISRRPIINKCFANVEVNFSGSGSDNQKFGGLTGCNQKGEIFNSFSLSTVTVEPASESAERVGGLAGCITLKGLVENSYSAGLVTVNGNVSLVGGLVGYVGTTNEGTVTSSYWDTEASGQTGSAGGTGETTADMRKQATFTGWNFTSIWNIIEDESYPFLRDFDLSGFDITDPGIQTAGEPFNIEITNAFSVGGKALSGSYSVVVTSDIVTEGPSEDGVVYDNPAVSFSGGEATLEGVVLKLAISDPGHILTVDIASILEDQDTEVAVDPAEAYKLEISQQPASTVFGNFDDQPAGLGTIILVTVDEFDNPSSIGLDQEQLVAVTIENDGSPGSDAIIGGTTQVDIQSGTATFDNINIDKEGEGYTLRFLSGSPVALEYVISDAFDIENIDDLSEFGVALTDEEATIYELLEFGLSITGALDNQAQPINGSVNVIVSSDLEGVVHNLDVEFTGGEANLLIALEELNEHILTVNVSGIKENETLEVTVHEDKSEFTVSVDPAQQYAAFPFDLFITGATDRDGNTITGLTNVVITSDIDGEVFNDNADFDSSGDATIIIALSEGDHALTVSVEGITHDQVITDLNIAENVSGFIVAEVVGDKTAGVGFDLEITQAKALDELINGDYNVTVTSDQEDNEPFIFSGVTFTDGAGTVAGVVLKNAHPTDPGLTLQHTLTVIIQGIDEEEEVEVEVTAAPASELVITTQPVGDEGTNDGTPLEIGNVVVETRDEFGNPSVSGLGDPHNVTASIFNDASAEEDATLGGDKTIDIQTGTATFSDLTLDRDGLGYTIQFETTLNESSASVVSDPFDMIKVENHIGFDVVDPGPQVVGENFTVQLVNARYSDGTLRNGEYNVYIESQGEAVLFNGNLIFIDGEIIFSTTSGFPSSGVKTALFRVAFDFPSTVYLDINVSTTDQSDFTITPPGIQTAGTPFDLDITGAKNKAGGDLDGREHYVTVTSDNLDEGVDGLLFSDYLAFEDGDATIEGIQLFTAGSQDLTVTIDWVTDPETESVTVDPAAATQFVIHQQPVGGDGSNDDIAVGVGEIILHFLDDYGNISTVGLDEAGVEYSLTVTADIESGPEEAELEGTTGRDIVDGVVTFDDLTLDKNGSYTLSFTYNGFAPAFDPNPVISNPFDMTNIENLEGFDVAHPGKQYQDLPFDLSITDAQNSAGVSFNGSINVTVTSSKADGEVFNDDVTFTDGAATVTISLNTIATDHNLTVEVAGISDDVVVEDVEVAADQSGFTLATDPVGGPFYQDNPFDLVISAATDLDGDNLDGSVLVIVTSDQSGDGEVHNEVVTFVSGGVSIPITLQTEFDSHTLTVEIAGVTASQQVSVNVLSNESGFNLALEVEDDKTAGVEFNLDITDAVDFSGAALDGSGHQVTVISDLSSEVYNNADVTFDNGSATVPVTINLAGSHTLTVSVQNIAESEQIGVNVLAAEVSKMLIETQPSGGTGTQDDTPAGIGTVVVRTADEFDNFSTEGLSGEQKVTVSLQVDGSGLTATLGGNDEVSISSGEAVFDDLTLNYDGTGYVLRFTYSPGEEDPDLELGFVDSEPFDMVDVNSYEISLDADDPLVFTTQAVGYDPVEADDVEISNTGGGIVTGLEVALSGDNPDDFTVTQPDPTSLNPGGNITFTVKPNDGLGIGSYSAIVAVTADKGISEQFEVHFSVLEEFAISLDPEGPVDFGIRAVGYAAVTAEEITVTRTGAGNITNLSVAMSGDEGEGTSDFTLTDPVETTLDGSTNSTIFTVAPKTELATGFYEETVIVTADNGVEESFTVTFHVVDEVVWEGTTSNWHTAGNWSTETVPDQYSVIRIPSTSNDPVISGANATVNELVIESGASLTVSSPRRLTINSGGRLTIEPGGQLTATGTLVNNAGIAGIVVESDEFSTGSIILNSSGIQATIHRYVTGNEWHAVSVPVAGQEIGEFLLNNDIFQHTSGYYAMTEYDETIFPNGGWAPYFYDTNTNELESGRSYIVRIRSSGVLTFQGELVTSVLNLSTPRTVSGWHSLGNPFPSALSIQGGDTDNFLYHNAVINENLDPDYAVLYIYDPANPEMYSIISNSQPIDPPGRPVINQDNIQLGQGFLVRTRDGSSTVNFTTGMRVHSTDVTFYKKSTEEEYWPTLILNVSNDSKEATTTITFNENMTTGLDITYDAGLLGGDPDFKVYTRLVEGDKGVNFAIQCLPDYSPDNFIIPVGFDFHSGGEVRFSTDVLSLPVGSKAILEDRVLEIFTDLGEDDFIVNLPGGTSGTGRFFIHIDFHITSSEGIRDEFGRNDPRVYSYGKEIFIEMEIDGITHASLYDLAGRKLKIVRLTESGRSSFRVDEIERGIYIVRLSGDNINKSTRLFIE